MMEMVDNPISRKSEQRISFTDIYSNSRHIESSGVTLGLILKEYCEFKVTCNKFISLIHHYN